TLSDAAAPGQAQAALGGSAEPKRRPLWYIDREVPMPSSAPDAAAILESRCYRAAHIDGVVVVSFFGDTKAEEFPALTKFIVDASAADGRKVELFAIIAPLDAVPSAAVRAATAEFARGTRDALETTNVVLVGE